MRGGDESLSAVAGAVPPGALRDLVLGLAGARRDMAAVTAREAFEGGLDCDGLHLVSLEALSLGMHPFREVHDVWVVHDNGRVVLEFAGGPVTVDPDALLFADLGERGAPRRSLPDPVDPPRTVTLGRGAHAVASVPCDSGGEIVVVATGSVDMPSLCAWRRDARNSADLTVLSGHCDARLARAEAFRHAESHLAPKAFKSSRPRDAQRSLVYRWEGSFGAVDEAIATIGECAALSEEVCDALGAPPPSVRLGRPDLVNHSYQRGGEVVMSAGMLCRLVVLHETAHHLAGRERSSWREPGHGPTFCGILAALYVGRAGADPEAARAEAAARGVKVDWDAFDRTLDGLASRPPAP